MTPRVAISIMVGMTAFVILFRLAQINWMLSVTAGAVMFGTGFLWAASYLSNQDDLTAVQEQSAAKLRAIGLIVIGIGALFGALMYLT